MKGICTNTWIPLRSVPTGASEMVSSLLYGETYTVIDKLDGWLKVLTDFDSYEGYISANQYSVYDNLICRGIATEPYFEVQLELHKILIPAGALLYHGDRVKEVPIRTLQPDFSVNTLLSDAKKFMGITYLWGGRCFAGIDCSGFTQICFKINGKHLFRDTSQQILQGTVVSFDERKSGDLIFFSSKPHSNVSHVGIIMDQSTVIHASGIVKQELYNNVGIINSEGIITHYFLQIRRLE